MVRIDTTLYFDRWLDKLKDRRTRVIIGKHIARIANNNFGVVRHVGHGVYEKKINYAGGYRLYYLKRGETWILLLCGGDKSTQQKDIKLAHELRKGLK